MAEDMTNTTPETTTPEATDERVKALEAEVERYKNAVSKANSEAADWKKKHNALLSEDERQKAAADEELNSLKEEIQKLRRNETIATYKSSYLSLGYTEELASATAAALADGDMAKVIDNQKKHLELHDKTLKADLMRNTPTPPAGANGNAALDYAKMAEDAQANGNFGEAAYYTRLAQTNKKGE